MEIRIGMIKIPAMEVNLFNSDYTSGLRLKRFSTCCSARVRQKKVCESCRKELGNEDIVKGTDKENILTNEQLDEIKKEMESQTINILSIETKLPNFYESFMPYVTKTQVLLPSIRKGYKKSDIKTYYGFFKALKETDRYCIGKLTSRGKENLVIIYPMKDDLYMSILPFNRRDNSKEIQRLKTAVRNEVGELSESDDFKDEAKKFVKQFDYDLEIKEVKEQKLQLLKKYLNEKSSNAKSIADEDNSKGVETNPFAMVTNKSESDEK